MNFKFLRAILSLNRKNNLALAFVCSIAIDPSFGFDSGAVTGSKIFALRISVRIIGLFIGQELSASENTGGLGI